MFIPQYKYKEAQGNYVQILSEAKVKIPSDRNQSCGGIASSRQLEDVLYCRNENKNLRQGCTSQ